MASLFSFSPKFGRYYRNTLQLLVINVKVWSSFSVQFLSKIMHFVKLFENRHYTAT
jgi:hypothetical protein